MSEREGQAKAGEVDDPGPSRAPAPGANDGEARIERLEARVAEMSLALGALDARLQQVEGAPASAARFVAEAALPPPSVRGVPPLEEPRLDALDGAPGEFDAGPTLGDALPQIAGIGGRTLLILGGGYLIRDLTERGTLTASTGALVGLVYAAIWLFVGHRLARHAPSISADFYGVTFALTSLPLLGEVTVRFGLLDPARSALAFAAAAAAGIFVAWHRRLLMTAWCVFALLVFTTVGTLLNTRQPVPVVLLLVGVGVALECAGAARGWLALRLAAAGVANVATAAFTIAELLDGEYSVLTTVVQLLMFGAYMLTFSVRAQVQKRALTSFEMLQATAVLVIGYLGAVWGAHSAPGAPLTLLGAASLVIGVGAYGIAYFLFVVPKRSPVEAWFNTSYALVGVLVGSWLLLPLPGYAWAGIGVLLAILGMRDKHGALPVHAALCAFVAALGSGLLTQVWNAFWTDPRVPWATIHAPAFVAAVAAWMAYLMPLESARTRALWASTAGKTLALAVAVAAAGGLLVAFSVGPLGGGRGEAADLGRIAALRTGIMAAAAIGLALASRHERFREAGLLVYPLLGVGAIKLVLQDFPNGRAITLFTALVLFGAASFFAPRLRFQEPKPASIRPK